MIQIVAYLRVSDKNKQRIDGLGIEAQRDDVIRFAAQHEMAIAAEFIEAKSAKDDAPLDKRPQLAAALKAAKKLKCPVVVSKLDRLSRSSYFIGGLMAHKVAFIVAELGPNVEPFTLHIFAAAAEAECRRIGQRTRAAIARLRLRGVTKNGMPYVPGNPALTEKNIADAMERARALAPQFALVSEASASQAAVALNAAGVGTPTGAPWSAQTVIRVRKRLARL